MKWMMRGAAATAVVGGIAARRIMAARRQTQDRWRRIGVRRREDGPRWHVVTINRTPKQLMPDDAIPEPLARLGEAIEVHVRPAPDGRGTELAARLRGGDPAPTARLREEDPLQALRAALRHSKQLAETGELLQPEASGATRRSLRNQPLQFATQHGREGGRL
jgi:hypothetical protein